MQLYYDIHDGTGPYVLMIHGFLSSRAMGTKSGGAGLRGTTSGAGVVGPCPLPCPGRAHSIIPIRMSLPLTNSVHSSASNAGASAASPSGLL